MNIYIYIYIEREREREIERERERERERIILFDFPLIYYIDYNIKIKVDEYIKLKPPKMFPALGGRDGS